MGKRHAFRCSVAEAAALATERTLRTQEKGLRKVLSEFITTKKLAWENQLLHLST